jgi:hypothetical protein
MFFYGATQWSPGAMAGVNTGWQCLQMAHVASMPRWLCCTMQPAEWLAVCRLMPQSWISLTVLGLGPRLLSVFYLGPQTQLCIFRRHRPTSVLPFRHSVVAGSEPNSISVLLQCGDVVTSGACFTVKAGSWQLTRCALGLSPWQALKASVSGQL